MNTGLDGLLKPRSIAIIGASDRAGRAGHIVVKNLLAAGFKGPIMPVTPKYDAVCGVLAYPNIASLPRTPELAVVCTQSRRNPQIIAQLGQRGVKAAIVLAAGMQLDTPSDLEKMQAQAKKYGVRLVGPNSMGIILPWLNLNASFAPIPANPGNIAFISQSAAVCTTILDWAINKDIGFSTFLSLGDTCDVDFDDMLDVLARDTKTRAILLYIDSVSDPRRFMSAARAASRNRRILVLKSGRTLDGAIASQLHTGGAIGIDPVYDAAIRRAGMLRVHNTHELFAAVETLTHAVPLRGERLAIVTNGGGPAVMAIDSLLERGGKLATLSEQSVESLDRLLPMTWSKANPIDIMGDADVKRYVDTITALLDSDDFDALLIMHSPSAIANSYETASAIIDVLKNHPKSRKFNILTNWSGESSAANSRRMFFQAGIPTYRTPESAVAGFMHLVEYRRNQKQLLETPQSVDSVNGSTSDGQERVQQALTLGHTELYTHEARPILESYGFETLRTWLAEDAAEAVHIAEQLGYPVAVKLRSLDIPHKSDVQGVVLQLRNAGEVATAAQAILDRVHLNYPDARVQGLLVQSMANTAGSQELRIGVYRDDVFGPVIVLGEGGSEWNIHQDAAIAIPPINMALARYLVINAIKTGKVKQRNLPNPVNVDALCRTLVRLSELIIDCPQIRELDINPLLVNGESMTVIDARMHLQAVDFQPNEQLAICPYPKQFEQIITLRNNQELLLRPILPEDEPLQKAFLQRVSEEDLYKRFFSDVGEMDHEAIANLTQIDYDREMAFVAVHPDGDIWGVARALSDPDNTEAEFAILIRSDLKGLGLGLILMESLIHYCVEKGLNLMTGMTMPSNSGMIALARKLGFAVDIQLSDGVVELVKVLR
uniref:bifunctional acetate--CoA ligase family protein/GNAT family N-acetyltransferase n=1 Tax=Thaumasiovibrio occultus TaxID=1891184 RepID=UPI000B35CC19|nr:bifunctional acetate--CoA ligase family protein/GNAT family N-acetyltransferase [Thaumasiovibrio occultus]